MKKRSLLTFFAITLLLSFLYGCGVKSPINDLPNESFSGELPTDTTPIDERFQESFTIGGILVSASDGLNETKTGTELTDTVEKLLAEKYGEEFCCEQYLYQEEFSLLVDLAAYPKANPELKFDLDVCGKDTLELRRNLRH